MSDIPSINNLNKEKTTKTKSKLDIFRIVLNKCVEKIVYANRHTDKTFVIFEVPSILIGYPMYDMQACILYLKQQFSKHGYLIEYIEPYYLYIDWGGRSTPQNVKSSSNVNEKLKQQTKDLLKQFPGTSKVEYVYEQCSDNTKKKNKNKN